MFKKVFVLFLIFAMAASFAACGVPQDTDVNDPADTDIPVTEDPANNDDDPINTGYSGGWTVADNEACVLPENVQTAFDKAITQFYGSSLKPVAYVANQVVAGLNYMILCESTPVTPDPISSYSVAIVYADFSGNATLTAVKDFKIETYTAADDSDISTEQLSGGWFVPEDAVGSAIPADAMDVFIKATEGLMGSGMVPLALLCTQVVSGVNYAFICKSTTMSQTPVSAIQIVFVHSDFSGNAEITNVATFDPASFNQ